MYSGRRVYEAKRAGSTDMLRRMAFGRVSCGHDAEVIEALCIPRNAPLKGTARGQDFAAASLPLADSVLPFIGLLQYYSSLGRDTSALLREARQRHPDNLNLLWLEAEALMQTRAFGAAILRLEKIVEMRDPSGPGISAGPSYDRKFFSLYPYRALANCHFRLKNFTASRRYFRLASECDPACQEYRVKETLCARLEAQSKRKISHEIGLEQIV